MTAATVAAPRAVVPPPRRRAGLLHRRAFRMLWIGETTSALGSSVSSVALPLIALTVLHSGVLAVSLLSGLAWVPWLVIGLPAGAWVDRLPRRPVMVICDVVSIVVFVSVPVAAWFGFLTMTQLLVVAVLSGTAEVFFSTAYRAYLPALLANDELVEGNSLLQASESAAQVAGPGLAGVLAQLVGAVVGLLADAVSFAVSLVCLRSIRVREERVVVARRPLRTEIAEGMRFLRGDRLLRMLTIFGGAANLVLTGYGAITVAFLVRGVGLSAASAGLLLAIGQVGGVLGAAIAPWLARSIGSARAMLVAKVGTTPLGLLIPLTGPGWRLGFFVVGATGLVAGIVGGNVISRGFTQAYCPPELGARISTSMQVINFGTIPLGALLGGVLAETFGFGAALWILLTGFVAASTILLFSPIRGHRDLPA